jgi:hypothetical protein
VGLLPPTIIDLGAIIALPPSSICVNNITYRPDEHGVYKSSCGRSLTSLDVERLRVQSREPLNLKFVAPTEQPPEKSDPPDEEL